MYFLTRRLIYLRREHDPESRNEIAGITFSSGIGHVREMRRYAEVFFQFAGLSDELLHPFDNAVAVLFDQRSVSFGKTTKLRSEDDQLAAVLDDRAKLITCFST